MFRFNAGRIENRMATLLGLGFSEANLTNLKAGKPICFKGNELKVKGCDFAIFYAADEAAIKVHLQNTMRLADQSEPTEPVKVLYIAESFYLAPLGFGDRTVYCIFFNDKSYTKMRGNESFNFRARFISEEGGDNLEVLLFAGKTESELAEQFKELI